MFNWLKGLTHPVTTLQCPTCGAKLPGTRGARALTCAHCGNTHVLNTGENIPLAYSGQLGQWLRAGDYEVLVHEAVEETVDDVPYLYVNVEYRNSSRQPALSCRRGQWIVFDTEGYSYEAEFDNVKLYKDRGKAFFGGERFLTPGMKARGWLAFKISPTATIERLQFFTGYLSTKAVDIQLRLA